MIKEVLKKNTSAFDLMPEAHQDFFRSYPGKIEIYSGEGVWVTVCDAPFRNHRYWNGSLHRVFRIAPESKPSIDWSQVHEDYNFLCKHQSGRCYLHMSPPYRRTKSWGSQASASAAGFKSLDPGTCDWEDSLVERPK